MKSAWLRRKLAPAAGSWVVRLLAATLRLRREEKTVEPLPRHCGTHALLSLGELLPLKMQGHGDLRS